MEKEKVWNLIISALVIEDAHNKNKIFLLL